MATSATDDSTPLMKQYNELKAQAGDALLFFRMGDFYELFGEDAVEAARLLEISHRALLLKIKEYGIER